MRSAWTGWLIFLGRFLPTRFREVVFEPACYDLVRETLERRESTGSLAPRMMGILVYVAVVNFPRVLFEDRRPSRLGVVLGTLVLLTLLALVAIRIALRGVYGL